jgi:hypothetical protein
MRPFIFYVSLLTIGAGAGYMAGRVDDHVIERTSVGVDSGPTPTDAGPEVATALSATVVDEPKLPASWVRKGPLLDVGPPANMIEPDTEICRALNTTCAGPQSALCAPSAKTKWSMMLTTPEANCIIAANGLVNRYDRLAWIHHCKEDFPCGAVDPLPPSLR